MQAAQNERITRIGPGTKCGALMRRYWQPVAMLDEIESLFRNYANSGTGKHRKYLHNAEEAAPYQQDPGT